MVSKSIFDGTDEIIFKALGLKPGQTLKHKSACSSLNISQSSFARTEHLVADLFAKIEDNWSDRTPSQSNWRLRRQTRLNPVNKSPEVLLERAITVLGNRGPLDGWYNQIPVASGLIDGKADKRAAVDLVRMSDGSAELVELKWESDTPAFAAFEILRYGLAFLLCYVMKEEFGFRDYPLMTASRVSLRCLAPADYYESCNLADLVAVLDMGIQDLFHKKTDGRLSTDLKIMSFPPGFDLPFKTGADVNRFNDLPLETPEIADLIDTMRDLRPV
jgi:hypothetical protein